MLREPRRLIASIIAIAVGVAFAAATLMISASFEQSINKQFAGPAQGSSIVVTGSSKHALSQELVTSLSKLPGVTKVHPTVQVVFAQKTSKGSTLITLRELPDTDSTAKVLQGRLPNAKGEIAFTKALAQSREATVGSTISIVIEETTGPVLSTLTIVGIIDPGDGYQDQSGIFAVATPDDLFRPSQGSSMSGEGYDSAFVFGGDPNALKASAKALSEVSTNELVVETGAEYLESLRLQLKTVLSIVTSFLLGFAAVALFVGALVIANTFSILVAQRSRQLALLRCVGATRGQVLRTVLGEAMFMGVVGAVVGVLLGAAFSFVLVLIGKAANWGFSSFAVTPLSIILPMAIAIVVTLVASLRPAFRATHVAPLAALQPQLEPAKGRRASLPVLILGAILTIGGIAGLIYGSIKPGWTSSTNSRYIILGIVGGFVSMVGFMMIATVIIPAMARVVGIIPARLGGVPGKLAVENSNRNPKRATSTASALLIGITLISMATVGAATAQSTYQRSLDRMFPSDLTVYAENGVSDSLLTRIRNLQQVQSADLVGNAVAKVNGSKGQVEIKGVGTTTRDVLRYPEYLDGLEDDTILVTAESMIADGSTVTVKGDKGTVTLKAVLPKRSMGGLLVTPSTLDKISASVESEAWLRLRDTNNATRQVDSILGDLQDVANVEVTGGAVLREQLQIVLNVILIVVIVLLGAAVLVAFVGISNTLSLSVLERTRESALLRALGLTRPQLRGMFSIEAIVLAGVGVLLGIMLGIGYGIAGSFALLNKTISEIAVDIPWLYLLGILLFGLVAGYLASVLPSIRAGKVQPAFALAAE